MEEGATEAPGSHCVGEREGPTMGLAISREILRDFTLDRCSRSVFVTKESAVGGSFG
jgi:hypothetical protein